MTFETVPDPTDPNRVALVRWRFPGWAFLPGAKVTIQFQVQLEPGTPADQVITDTGRVSAGSPFTCDRAIRDVVAAWWLHIVQYVDRCRRPPRLLLRGHQPAAGYILRDNWDSVEPVLDIVQYVVVAVIVAVIVWFVWKRRRHPEPATPGG